MLYLGVVCGVDLSILLRYKTSLGYLHSAMVCSLIHEETFHMKLGEHCSQSEATDGSVKLMLPYKDLTDCADHSSHTHSHSLIQYCLHCKCHRLIQGLQN